MRTPPLLLLLIALLAPWVEAQELLYELESPTPVVLGSFGSSVSGVPDADGDGVPDLLVGASGEDPGGYAYVFSGASGALLYELVSPNEQQYGGFGGAVSGVPDVDGDGRGDLLVGADTEDPGSSPVDAGRAYLFSGASGALLHTLRSPNEVDFGYFGQRVSGVQDVDGDGRGDLLVSVSSNEGEAGRAYVFSGATGALLHQIDPPDPQSAVQFAGAISGVPDVDGDGRGDLLIGDRLDSSAGAFVFSGATGALLYALVSPDPEPFGFGWSVSGVPDLDEDGRGDLLIGAQWEGPSFTGQAYVFSGATGALLHVIERPSTQLENFFASVVSGVPDADGDGAGDLLIGDYTAHLSVDVRKVGRVYLFSGASGELLYEIAPPNPEEDGRFGWSVSGVPDVDGDGRGDLLVGADREGIGGRAYVFSGGASGTLVVDAEPVSPPVAIPPTGGTFTYTVTTTNATAATATFQLWTRVTKPNGQQTRVLRGPLTRTLAPGASVTDELTQSVPGGIPAGTYTYTAYVGTYPDEVVASDGFAFTKTGASLARPGGEDALWQEAAGASVQASATGEPAPPLVPVATSPNPFSSRTTLTFVLPKAARVRLTVYDVLGRAVAVLVDGPLAAGSHAVAFDASALPGGTYLARLEAGGEVHTQRVTLLR